MYALVSVDVRSLGPGYQVEDERSVCFEGYDFLSLKRFTCVDIARPAIDYAFNVVQAGKARRPRAGRLTEDFALNSPAAANTLRRMS